MFMFDLWDDDVPLHHFLYRGFSEKSANARRREEEATRRFDGIRNKLETALVTNKLRVVELGRKPGESHSLFQCLPDVTIQHIFEYVAETKPSLYQPLGSATQENTASGAAAKKKKKSGHETEEEGGMDLTHHHAAALDIVDSLYTPGQTHVIHVSNPDLHLTGPCWRDFSRHVRSFPHWDVKRTAATPAEKAKWGESHRKGKAYFIRVTYTVPGTPTKTKKTKKKRASNVATTNETAAELAADMDSKPPANKKRKSGVTSNETVALQAPGTESGVTFNETGARYMEEDAKPPAAPIVAAAPSMMPINSGAVAPPNQQGQMDVLLQLQRQVQGLQEAALKKAKKKKAKKKKKASSNFMAHHPAPHQPFNPSYAPMMPPQSSFGYGMMQPPHQGTMPPPQYYMQPLYYPMMTGVHHGQWQSTPQMGMAFEESSSEEENEDGTIQH